MPGWRRLVGGTGGALLAFALGLGCDHENGAQLPADTPDLEFRSGPSTAITVDVVADEQACFLLSYACETPDSVEVHVDGALAMQWHQPPELAGAAPAGGASPPPSYCHHTHELSNGPHVFALSADCGGAPSSDTVTASTSAPTFRVARLTASRPWYAVGDTILLELDATADGLAVTADFSDVDPNYTPGSEQVTALGGGLYEIRHVLGRYARPKRGAVAVAVSDGALTKERIVPVLALPDGYPRASLAVGTFVPSAPVGRTIESGSDVRDVTIGSRVPSSTQDPQMFDDTTADIDGTRTVTIDYVAPDGVLVGDRVDIEMVDPARDGHFASEFEITAKNCPRELSPMCEYEAKGFLQESPHAVAPGDPLGQATFRVVFSGGSATPWSAAEDFTACPDCGPGTISITGNIDYTFEQCRPDTSNLADPDTSPQIYGSTCTVVNRPAPKLLVEVSAMGSTNQIIMQRRTFADASGGFKLNIPDTAAERPHVIRVYSATPKQPGERVAVGAWLGPDVEKVSKMTGDPADYDVHYAVLANVTPQVDGVPKTYGYLLELGDLTIDVNNIWEDAAWATHIVDETKRGIDYFGAVVDTSKMHGINICWQSSDIGLVGGERANQNHTGVHPSFILILKESTSAFVVNHELAHYFHREYMRPLEGYGRFNEPMATTNAGMVYQHYAPGLAKLEGGNLAGSWMTTKTSYKSMRETLDFNANYKVDEGQAQLEESNLQFFADAASYADCNNRPECCGKDAKDIPLCVMGRQGFLQRIFWDLHDGVVYEPWAPGGVAAEFDEVDGGVNSANPANHGLLDALFGYLGGGKQPQNSNYVDRGMEKVDHVDVLDGMMCRGHMTAAQAEAMLHQVMNYDYDFDEVATAPCPSG